MISSVLGPKLIVHVYSASDQNDDTVRGYGIIHLPVQPGRLFHCSSVDCFALWIFLMSSYRLLERNLKAFYHECIFHFIVLWSPSVMVSGLEFSVHSIHIILQTVQCIWVHSIKFLLLWDFIVFLNLLLLLITSLIVYLTLPLNHVYVDISIVVCVLIFPL